MINIITRQRTTHHAGGEGNSGGDGGASQPRTRNKAWQLTGLRERHPGKVPLRRGPSLGRQGGGQASSASAPHCCCTRRSAVRAAGLRSTPCSRTVLLPLLPASPAPPPRELPPCHPLPPFSRPSHNRQHTHCHWLRAVAAAACNSLLNALQTLYEPRHTLQHSSPT